MIKRNGMSRDCNSRQGAGRHGLSSGIRLKQGTLLLCLLWVMQPSLLLAETSRASVVPVAACETEIPPAKPDTPAITLRSLAGSAKDTLTAKDLLPPNELAAEPNRYTLVDIRPAKQFGRYFLPGSLNLQAFAIKTRPYLKERHLVLVDEGYRPLLMQTVLAELKSAGFDQVQILDGGLTGWIRQGGKVDGDPFAAREVNAIEPDELLNQISWPGWRFIVLRQGAKGEQMKMPLPAQEVSLNDKSAAAVSKELSSIIAALSAEEEYINVVILGDAQLEDWQLDQRVSGLGYANLFTLRGGIAELLDATRRHQHQLQSQGQRGGKSSCGSR